MFYFIKLTYNLCDFDICSIIKKVYILDKLKNITFIYYIFFCIKESKWSLSLAENLTYYTCYVNQYTYYIKKIVHKSIVLRQNTFFNCKWILCFLCYCTYTALLLIFWLRTRTVEFYYIHSYYILQKNFFKEDFYWYS